MNSNKKGMPGNLENGEKELLKFLYPEILTRDQLCDILQKRYLLSSTERAEVPSEQLIQKFRQFVQPKPQRSFTGSSSLVEQHIAQRQSRVKTRSSFHLGETSVDGPSKRRSNVSDCSPRKFSCSYDPSAQRTSTSISSSAPLPACIDFTKKTIKLSSSIKGDSTSGVVSSATGRIGMTSSVSKVTSPTSGDAPPACSKKRSSAAISKIDSSGSKSNNKKKGLMHAADESGEPANKRSGKAITPIKITWP